MKGECVGKETAGTGPYLEYRALMGLVSCREQLMHLEELLGQQWKIPLQEAVVALTHFQSSMAEGDFYPPLDEAIPPLREFARALRKAPRYVCLPSCLRAEEVVVRHLREMAHGLMATSFYLQWGKQEMSKAAELLIAACDRMPVTDYMGEQRYLISHQELAQALENMGDLIANAAIQIFQKSPAQEMTPA